MLFSSQLKLITNLIIRTVSLNILLGIWLMSSSCQINRTINGYRHGRWIYAPDMVEKDLELLIKQGYRLSQELKEGYSYRGRYKEGAETGTWRYYMNGKLVRKEKYNGERAYTRFYHSNGIIDCKGETFWDSSEGHIHWYYSGLWKCYDENGLLIVTRKYEKGKMVLEEYQLTGDQ